MRASRFGPLVVSLLLGAVPVPAGPPPCEFAGVPRVVAVGDVHGAHDGFVTLLRSSGIVDDKLRWAGGKAHLVQTGDVPDRGPHSRRALDLLRRLEREASKAGGRVHALLGNHEVMNLVGDLRYVSPAEYEAFRTPDSERRRESHYRLALAAAERQAEALGSPLDVESFRERYFREIPLGFLEHRQAFGPDGTYGRWLRQHNAVVKINGVVFVHGGLTPELAALGCASINATVRRELEDLEKSRSAPGETLSLAEGGPLWYRGLAQEDEATLGPKLDRILAAMGARAVVVGHTVTGTGRIETRAGGRVVMIDVGMLDLYGGHLMALEIGPQGLVAVRPDGRERLEVWAPAAAAP